MHAVEGSVILSLKGLGGGVNLDLLPSELPMGVWSNTLNVSFQGGFAQTRGGVTVAYTVPTVVPYYLQTFNTSASRFLVQAGTAKVFVDDGTTRTEITNLTPFTGARDNRWTGGDLNGVLILNNGVDTPQYWNGNVATKLADLTSWPTGYKADFVRPFKNYVVAGSITKAGTKYPNLVMWSNATDPGSIPTTYTASTTNDAGEQPISGIGKLIDCLPLGDVNILYGESGRYAMQYIGGTQVFRLTRLPGVDGLLAPGCVVQTPKGHVFLTNGDVMLHNGAEAVSIVQDRIRIWLFLDTMSATVPARSFLCVNPYLSEVWVFFPTNIANTWAVAAWNWLTDTWAIHQFSNITYATSGLVAAAVAPFNDGQQMVLATETPQIGLANGGTTDFGAAYQVLAEKQGIRPSDENKKFFIRRSEWDFQSVFNPPLTVYHGMSNTANGTPTYVSTSYTPGSVDWVSLVSKRGRYAAVKFSYSSTDPVAIRTIRLDLREAGQE